MTQGGPPDNSNPWLGPGGLPPIPSGGGQFPNGFDPMSMGDYPWQNEIPTPPE